MLSKNANYDLDQASQELMLQENILKNLIDTQVILQLLVQKEIVTREEVTNMRVNVRSRERYRSSIEYINQAKRNVEYYQQHPEQHLKDLLEAKTSGKIK